MFFVQPQMLGNKGSPSKETKHYEIIVFYSSALGYFNIVSMRLAHMIDEPVCQQLEMCVSLTSINLCNKKLSG